METGLLVVIIAGWIIALGGLLVLYINLKGKTKHSR